MSDSLPPVVGLVAGKYQIVGLIGRGGMGSVWEGRHSSLGTRVAIKFIDQEYVENEEACARFVTEARAAATIQSKHAIQIFDHGVTDDGRPYIVMELLNGEPLDKRIERLKALSLRDTARIIGHVCRALQRAHDAGIIHRDLKPENVFLVRSPDDEDEIAKVLDFGIAKIKAPPGEQGVSSSTKTGAVLGTPYYMSPEQARGLRNVDHRSDLWSLGVIAHKCVTGVLPFEGESVGDLLVKICTSPLPTPSMTMPGLPRSFDAWFARALEREPSQRFSTATELAEALALAAGLSGRQVGMGSSGAAASAVALAAATTAPAIQEASPALAAAGVTSAPFTASPVPAKANRGVMVTAGVAAVLGGLIGIVAVARLASRASPQNESTREAPTASAATAPPNAPVTAMVPSASSRSTPLKTTDPPTTEPKAAPDAGPANSPTTTSTSARPVIAPPNPPAAHARPVAPAQAPPVKVPPAKPTLSPNPADPGY